jgi:glycosyltransferase involved in cell wall biosynthesis
VDLDGIDVHRAGGRYTFSVAGPRYFRRHLADRDFDVVVEDLNKVPAFTRYWVDAPVVLLVHHLFGGTAFQAAAFPVALGTWALERLIPVAFRDTPVISVSESTKQDLVSRGLRDELIEVVPNGIDLDWYTPGPKGSRAAQPTLLFMGRLKKYKRVDLVVQAVQILAEQGLDLRLIVCGAGDQLDTLKAEAKKLGIEGRVRFAGFVAEEEKRDLMRQAWVHVLTSPKEGWGISNLEAAACGTPTVASDSPGLRESVLDGETGVLVPHGNVDALVDALGTLLRDEDTRGDMGRRARVFAETFSWDASAERVGAFLSRVVGRTGGG